MAREEKTLTELEFQPTLDVDRANDLIWTVDVSDKSMSEYGTSKKVKVEAFIGDKGDAATVDVGTTTTGLAGTNANVVNSGTTSDAILDFTIPRGDKGDKGDTGLTGPAGADGVDGEDAYVYIAYASDSSGTGFTTTFNANLDYIAIKSTTTPIATPQASDFTGLWKNYKGIQGIQGEQGVAGEDGSSAYVYIAYASDANGTGFTTTFDASLDYIAIKATTSPIASPQVSDFTGLWKNYKGEKGDKGDTGAAGADGEDGLDINWKGTYSGATAYVVNDAVFYDGSSYICILNSTGNLPTNTTYWNLMAQEGAAGEGSGDVSGPSSSTDNALARFDGVTGKLIQGSLVTVNDSGSVNIPSGEQYLVDGSPVQGYSDKEAQDAIGDILEDTTTVGLTYDDTEPSITADIKDSSIGNSKLATMASKTYKGRTAADTGAVEDVPIATLKTDLGLTKSDIGLSNVDDLQQMPKSYLDTDATLAANSDEKVPSQKAVKTYADSKGYAWKGAWATSTPYSLNDTVENNGSGYVCTADHTSSATTEPGVGASWTTNWDLFVEGMGEPNITEDTTTDLEGYLYGDGSNVGVKSEQDIRDIILDYSHPIGTIYETTSSDLNTVAKMNAHFGGTWEAYGSGRVLVAKSSDTEFDTIGETGGAKTHTLTVAEMPAHTHSYTLPNNSDPNFMTGGGIYNVKTAGGTGTATTSAGSGMAHNNLQPYIVVYRYRRTA